MVSMNPNSPEGFYLDAKGMTLPGINPFSTTPAPENSPATAVNAKNCPADDPSNKKIRKPYTISKSRESWTDPEHDKFLEALQLFDRDWKKIEAFIGSKTVIQIRSHAQKYFLKAQKSGSNEHLPPPRPKRKASHPYPQKAPKSATSLPQLTGALESSSGLVESIVQKPADSAPMPRRSNNSTVPSWAANSQTVGVPSEIKDPMRSTQTLSTNNYSSSTERTAIARATAEVNDPLYHDSASRVLPDFSHVYNFIGSLFDPEASDHLRRLKKMDPIDVETTLLLMRNLSINLISPEFEDHRRLLASYDTDSGGITNSLCGG